MPRFEHAAPERAAVALSGDTLIVAHASTLQVFDLRPRAETKIEIPSRPIHTVAVDERRAYVFEMGLHDVRVVDLQWVVTELPTAIEVEAVGRGPNDAVVIVGAGMVQVWDGTALRFTLPGAAYATSADGALFATGTGNGVVSIYDAKRAVLLEQFQATTTTIKQLTFSADGRRLVAEGDTVSIWDIPRETAPAAAVAQRLSTIP